MVRQIIPARVFPSGSPRYKAVLADEPVRLAQRHGLAFQRDFDDLGEFQIAAIELADGSQAWLLKHLDEDAPGTPALGDQFADPDEFCRLLCEALSCTSTDLSWRLLIDSVYLAESFAMALGASAPRLAAGFPIDFVEKARINLDVRREIVEVIPLTESADWRLTSHGRGQQMIVKTTGELPPWMAHVATTVDAGSAGAVVRGINRHLLAYPTDLNSRLLRDQIQSYHLMSYEERLEAYRQSESMYQV